MKQLLPKEIKDKMKRYREGHGLLRLPQDYIDFHEKLALQELNNLVKAGFKPNVTCLESDEGSTLFWGMKIVKIEGEYQGKHCRLKWCESNQEFFIALPDNCGWVPFNYQKNEVI